MSDMPPVLWVIMRAHEVQTDHLFNPPYVLPAYESEDEAHKWAEDGDEVVRLEFRGT